MSLTVFLLVVSLALFSLTAVFTYESVCEKEFRASKIGAVAMLLSGLTAFSVFFIPSLHIVFVIIYGAGVLFVVLLFVPGKQNGRALKGAAGYLVETGKRFDERNIVFARNRLPDEDTAIYKKYYADNPEYEEADRKRRAKGVLGIPGSIDRGYRPNLSMLFGSFDMPDFLGPFARQEPHKGAEPFAMDPAKAAHIIKEYAKHIGAAMVGICEVNPLWIYANRGEIHYNNWQDWGKELDNVPKYAIVILTEMNWEHVSSAPHTPSVAESANNYAKGAYLSTMMASYVSHMGYRGLAQNTRNYDVLLTPLAVDAGLGEVGRQGYLIAPKYGARVRIFATLTDMPLKVDKPISIGVDEFCRACKKCAETCPSRSIPMGGKTVFNGVEKWKLEAETCFDFWGKVGTDCSICMAVCPYSRPDTFSHKLVRWFIRRSPIARTFFPYIDNWIYGKKWKPRKVAQWLDYPKGPEFERETYEHEDVRSIG